MFRVACSANGVHSNQAPPKNDLQTQVSGRKHSPVGPCNETHTSRDGALRRSRAALGSAHRCRRGPATPPACTPTPDSSFQLIIRRRAATAPPRTVATNRGSSAPNASQSAGAGSSSATAVVDADDDEDRPSLRGLDADTQRLRKLDFGSLCTVAAACPSTSSRPTHNCRHCAHRHRHLPPSPSLPLPSLHRRLRPLCFCHRAQTSALSRCVRPNIFIGPL